ALDRVNRAKNAGERVAITGILLEMDQFAVEQVEILAALDQEFADDVVAHAESRFRKNPFWRCAGDKGRLIQRCSSLTRTSSVQFRGQNVTPGMRPPTAPDIYRQKIFMPSRVRWMEVTS